MTRHETPAAACRAFADSLGRPQRVITGVEGLYLEGWLLGRPLETMQIALERFRVPLALWSFVQLLSGDEARVYLHRFVRPDEDSELHSHPWDWAVSHILCGGYDEERRTDRDEVVTTHRRAGDTYLLTGPTFHRVARLADLDTWTLFVVGPRAEGKRKDQWGFWSAAGGFVDREAFLRAKGTWRGGPTTGGAPLPAVGGEAAPLGGETPTVRHEGDVIPAPHSVDDSCSACVTCVCCVAPQLEEGNCAGCGGTPVSVASEESRYALHPAPDLDAAELEQASSLIRQWNATAVAGWRVADLIAMTERHTETINSAHAAVNAGRYEAAWALLAPYLGARSPGAWADAAPVLSLEGTAPGGRS